ncbi:MAG: glycosyltransferase family 4 protein [Candidatus Nealsonbacteria bacterium]|nr:glycosyltransferase family 4 protein [Candidatus Nealsonbacteria bacterium]
MNILLINHYAGSAKHGMEYRPYYLAREWVRLGHRVTIVAASCSHVRVTKPRMTSSFTEEDLDGVHYVWIKTPDYQGNGVRRVANMFAFVAQLLRYGTRLVRQCEPDAVIASSTYPLDIYPARHIARKAGAKLVFEVHDLWPLTPMELGGMSRWHPFIFLLQRGENYACRHADRIVSILPKADEHLRQHGMADDKFVHVPNGVDVEQWQTGATPLPPQHVQALTQLREDGRFIVGYAGGHGLSNALGAVVRAAERLQSLPVTIVLVGHGPEKEGLQKKVKQLALTNVVFLPPVPKTAVGSLLAQMDILYIGWNRSPLYRFGISPNKLLDYMMAAKPIVHAVEAGNDPVAEAGCGVCCRPEAAEEIADAVSELMGRTPEERAAMGQRGRDYVMRHHQYPDLAQQFLDAVTR